MLQKRLLSVKTVKKASGGGPRTYFLLIFRPFTNTLEDLAAWPLAVSFQNSMQNVTPFG